MSETTEIVVAWLVILVVGTLMVRGMIRNYRRPKLRMWNQWREAEPNQPFFGPGVWDVFWYAAGFATSATAIHFLVVR